MEKGDYYSNHNSAAKFPWTIYHRPLEQSLLKFIEDNVRRIPHPKGLVIGSGFLHELKTFPSDLSITAADIDARVIEYINSHLSLFPQVKRAVVVTDPKEYYQYGPFDFIYAKEVIEHIEEAEHFVKSLVQALKPKGQIWLSTPNYGDFVLPLIENTFLEIVAQLKGFSRKEIHPRKFDQAQLKSLLVQAGFLDVEVFKTPLNLALTVRATRP